MFYLVSLLYIQTRQLRVWDCRQPNPVATITLSERVYCMDAREQAMVTLLLIHNMSIVGIHTEHFHTCGKGGDVLRHMIG
jgi:hypothetical protein